jgi:FkbM family methyltransferase
MTLCAASRTGASGQVHAFEPSLRNARMLARHLRWNDLGQVRVRTHALSSYDGEASFGGGPTSKTHALGGKGETVAVRRGASLISSGECRAPSFVKIDVEGAEGEVAEGLGAELPGSAGLLIAVHSAAADRKCCAALAAHGFELVPSPGILSSRRSGWGSDPDLLCLGPDYARDGSTERLVAAFRAGRSLGT